MAFEGDSRARVSIRSYYFVDNWDGSSGAYGLGSVAVAVVGVRENARDSGKEEKKAAELNHRKNIEGVERQLAWGNPHGQ